MMWGEFALAGVVAFLVGSVLAKPLLKLLIRAKSEQTVSEFVPEHAAKQGTPTMGGILVLLAAMVAIPIATDEWLAPMALIVGFGLIGWADDYLVPKLKPGARGLGWIPKLAMQIAVAVGVALLGGAPWQEAAIWTFVVLFFSNAYNFADGLDGLAGGLGLILAVALATIAPVPMAAVGGGLLAFLWLNAPPAKVFMGDVGSLPIGALFGSVVGAAVLSGELGAQQYVGLSLISGVMVAELVPPPLQILSAKLRKGKRFFPSTPIHHAFQQAGIPETRVVSGFLIVQAALALLGVWVSFGMPTGRWGELWP